jgi:hypothetical protein
MAKFGHSCSAVANRGKLLSLMVSNNQQRLEIKNGGKMMKLPDK